MILLFCWGQRCCQHDGLDLAALGVIVESGHAIEGGQVGQVVEFSLGGEEKRIVDHPKYERNARKSCPPSMTFRTT